MNAGATGASAAAAAGAAAAATAQAIKASGAIIQLEPRAFLDLVGRQERPLIVHAQAGFFSKHHRYLAAYRGLIFTCSSTDAISLPSDAETVESEKIWVP